MNLLPLLERELRSEARQSMNRWLRALACVIMMAIAFVVLAGLGGNAGGRGTEMFGALQPTLFSLIWLLGPIMTCDCISRERREGTLGLLFLTPLRPVDIGLSKAFSGILRALTLILASLPVLAIPLLLGGVSGRDLSRAAMMDGMALAGAISAGLLASSRCRQFNRAALLSLFLAALFLLLLGFPAVMHLMAQGVFGRLVGSELPLLVVLGPWVFCSGVDGIWQNGPAATSPTLLRLAGAQLAAGFGLLLLTLVVINRTLRRLSVETGMTARQTWWWELLCAPRFFKRLLRRSNTGMLNRNPIGWLQRRTWSARVSSWGWLGALILVETTVLSSGGWHDLHEIQPALAAFLGVGIAFSAADSFGQERQTGALELLLVTPLSPKGMMLGRLFGIWTQYLLVVGLLVGTWWYVTSVGLSWRQSEFSIVRYGFVAICVSSLLSLAVIGLDQSLHRKHFISAWLLTVGLGLVVPMVGPVVAWFVFLTMTGLLLSNDPFTPWTFGAFVVLGICLQATIAGLSAWHCHQNLVNRRFAMERG